MLESYGGFLGWGHPKSSSHQSILVLKPIVLRIPHLRNPHMLDRCTTLGPTWLSGRFPFRTHPKLSAAQPQQEEE